MLNCCRLFILLAIWGEANWRGGIAEWLRRKNERCFSWWQKIVEYLLMFRSMRELLLHGKIPPFPQSSHPSPSLAWQASCNLNSCEYWCSLLNVYRNFVDIIRVLFKFFIKSFASWVSATERHSFTQWRGWCEVACNSRSCAAATPYQLLKQRECCVMAGRV